MKSSEKKNTEETSIYLFYNIFNLHIKIFLIFIRLYTSYEDLEKDFVTGDVHPGDLKKATAKAINELIEPVR